MKTAGKARSRAEWKRLVAEWRGSGKTAGAFAAEQRISEGTLRWWAWELGVERIPRRKPAVPLVPVTVVEDSRAVGTPDPATRVAAWTLRTTRGELSVQEGCSAEALYAVIAGLLEGES